MGRSPLSWGRGLKLIFLIAQIRDGQSPLSWGRGLKLCFLGKYNPHLSSPLSWGRGLKLLEDLGVGLIKVVAPLVGAWIETFITLLCLPCRRSPLSWGRGLKHLGGYKLRISIGRPSRGGVD